ncbi:CinA family protein [Marinomonas sp. 15G1-11]|uniref:CinA family protein n=1 Tax=Marinomonas phaeophyticola TaxID=3004091 RepID=A0ABT4JV27_9GAMM|nr:CinA family protein [Marinomonas sp. 15G1-11]MCZ2722085.1 CinA family protein [Marinomonas sp. 15G1-11]
MIISTEIKRLVSALSERLIEKEYQLATAESCTGGLIGAACTEQEGSSAWFQCALVTYSNESKQRLLGVQADTLLSYGAVSRETVSEMCVGALNQEVDVVVSVSGIAGPGGATEGKPVGTVYIGWQKKGSPSTINRFNFDGDRSEVREKATTEALKGLIKLLE